MCIFLDSCKIILRKNACNRNWWPISWHSRLRFEKNKGKEKTRLIFIQLFGYFNQPKIFNKFCFTYLITSFNYFRDFQIFLFVMKLIPWLQNYRGQTRTLPYSSFGFKFRFVSLNIKYHIWIYSVVKIYNMWEF